MPQLTDRKNRQQTWLSNPQSDHRVHFYQMENDLIDSLGEYVSTGLDKKETCIVMAKPATIIKLNKKLRAGGVNLSAVLSSGQYIAYDADDLLAQFMRQGVPDLEEFSLVAISVADGSMSPIGSKRWRWPGKTSKCPESRPTLASLQPRRVRSAEAGSGCRA